MWCTGQHRICMSGAGLYILQYAVKCTALCGTSCNVTVCRCVRQKAPVPAEHILRVFFSLPFFFSSLNERSASARADAAYTHTNTQTHTHTHTHTPDVSKHHHETTHRYCHHDTTQNTQKKLPGNERLFVLFFFSPTGHKTHMPPCVCVCPSLMCGSKPTRSCQHGVGAGVWW